AADGTGCREPQPGCRGPLTPKATSNDRCDSRPPHAAASQPHRSRAWAHRTLPPVVHVAGTNGKGSLVAYLRAMAEAAGYRVHVYTSPHLVHFNERIRGAGTVIEDGELDE